ncbi:MAG: hypothetical protein AAB892_01210, partial [Patescibacteria group bacterium]
VAGILAVLLIIMTVMWGRESGTFTLGAEDLSDQRNKVAEACKSADDLESPACKDALDDLARLLGRFDKKLEKNKKIDGEASTTVEVAP